MQTRKIGHILHHVLGMSVPWPWYWHCTPLPGTCNTALPQCGMQDVDLYKNTDGNIILCYNVMTFYLESIWANVWDAAWPSLIPHVTWHSHTKLTRLTIEVPIECETSWADPTCFMGILVNTWHKFVLNHTITCHIPCMPQLSTLSHLQCNRQAITLKCKSQLPGKCLWWFLW